MQQATAPEPPRAAIDLLALPALDGLSERQVRGSDCVWCAVTLAPETAVDLGPRRKRILDTHRDWFPRGCRRCVGRNALVALHDHAPKCEQCVGDAGRCEIGVGLRRLMRGAWR